MNTPTTATKAVIGSTIAGLGALATALADSRLEPVEVVTVALATVTALGVVYGVPNAPKATKR